MPVTWIRHNCRKARHVNKFTRSFIKHTSVIILINYPNTQDMCYKITCPLGSQHIEKTTLSHPIDVLDFAQTPQVVWALLVNIIFLLSLAISNQLFQISPPTSNWSSRHSIGFRNGYQDDQNRCSDLLWWKRKRTKSRSLSIPKPA